MSVVAWDGKTLAVDRQGDVDGMKIPCPKSRRMSDGTILAWTGTLEKGLALAQWYEQGQVATSWPVCQQTDDWARLIVVKDGVPYEYERLPIAQKIESPFMAWGSGREFAMGAFHMGANATQAVEAACALSAYCGMGMDVYDLKDGK